MRKRAAAVLLAAACTAAPAGPAQEAGDAPAFHGARPVAMAAEHLDGTPFKSPQGLHYDAAHDEVFIADSGNGLVGIFDGRGVPKFTFAPARRGSYPVDVGTDAEGNIYVAIAGSRVLRIFNYRGEPSGTSTSARCATSRGPPRAWRSVPRA